MLSIQPNLIPTMSYKSCGSVVIRQYIWYTMPNSALCNHCTQRWHNVAINYQFLRANCEICIHVHIGYGNKCKIHGQTRLYPMCAVAIFSFAAQQGILKAEFVAAISNRLWLNAQMLAIMAYSRFSYTKLELLPSRIWILYSGRPQKRPKMWATFLKLCNPCQPT